MDINGAIAEWLTEVLREIGDPSTLFDHAREVAAQAHQLREAQKQLEDAAGERHGRVGTLITTTRQSTVIWS